jgi:hypothetical protein
MSRGGDDDFVHVNTSAAIQSMQQPTAQAVNRSLAISGLTFRSNATATSSRPAHQQIDSLVFSKSIARCYANQLRLNLKR